MPVGTVCISRAGLKPATYEVTFVRPDPAKTPAPGSLTLQGPESLRPFLDSIGIAERQRDDAVRAAIQEGEATVANVHLTQEFVDQHGL